VFDRNGRNNDISNSRPIAHRRPQTTPMPHDPSTASLTSLLFHSGQLRHHAANWQQLPVGLATRYDALFNSIVPPMPNPQLKTRLAEIRDEGKGQLLATMLGHIEEARKNVNTQLAESNAQADVFDRAAQAARERLIQRYRRKIRISDINAWLAEDLLTTGGRAAVNQPADAAVATTEWTAATDRHSKRRRSATGSDSASPVSDYTNRFDALIGTMDDVPAGSEEEEEGSPAPTPRTQKRNPPVVKKSKLATAADGANGGRRTIDGSASSIAQPTEGPPDTEGRSTSNGAPSTSPAPEPQSPESDNGAVFLSLTRDDTTVIAAASSDAQSIADWLTPRAASQPDAQSDSDGSPLDSESGLAGKVKSHYNKTKASWTATVDEKTSVLIIGDSNIKLARSLPVGWEAHVFSGAKLDHAAAIIDKLKPSNNLRSIVVAVGINNRTWQFDGIKHDLYKVSNSLARKNVAGYFVGVSLPPELPREETNRMKSLNSTAKERFRHRYIEAVKEVSVSPTDEFRIHYDQVTVDRIIESIKSHLRSVFRGTGGRKISL